MSRLKWMAFTCTVWFGLLIAIAVLWPWLAMQDWWSKNADAPASS